MDPKLKLSEAPGIGPYFAFRLSKLGLSTLEDLIYHFPFRYDDFSNLTSASAVKEGERATLKGEIWSIKNVYAKSGKTLTQAILNDGTSAITLTWFNQPWLTKQIKVGDRLQVSGKLTIYKNKPSIAAPIWERIEADPIASGNHLHTGRLVPVYPETEGLTSKWLRNKIASVLPKVLPQLQDPLPDKIRDAMLPLTEALEKIHFPASLTEAEKARERLGFDELFFTQLAALKTRREWQKKPSVDSFKVEEKQVEKFLQSLPFELTNAQKRVIREILQDLQKNEPMNRLLQGEVGSGKTVVAAVIAYVAYLNGFRTLFMAPTEILAFQHFGTLSRLLESHGVKVGSYTGSRKYTKSQKDLKPDVIVGTHALLSDKLLADNVGLIVVDEQQRFGVEQRSLLRSKAKIPHFLTMTATPIPRTVALTLYGDLELSIIDELPKGRQQISTHVVPNAKRADAYRFIARKIKDGDQAYVITPLIEQSETLQSVRAAKVEFDRLQRTVFPDLKLGLLHGRLSSKDKERVINAFKEGELQILVSTSVVEVGVDVANATIMLVESADRFGLAQLHQLRGRVGRGTRQSYCLLFTDGDRNALSRLKSLEKINDGLKLAELDLKIRGSGQLFGTAQSGRIELKIADLSNLALVEKSRLEATKILTEDPNLRRHPLLASRLQTASGGSIMPD